MNRKNFLSSTAAVVGLTALSPLEAFEPGIEIENATIKPPYLKKGDLIGITAPAGYIKTEEIQPAVKKMESWGYTTRIGKTINEKNYTFAGTDEERANDLQQMLDDTKIKAIMCARGGYGAVRIIDKIKWDKFKLKPKWIIGFSDITVFHSHINRHFGIATIHSKMCNSFPEDWINAEPIQIETIDSIHKALSGEKMRYNVSPNTNNRLGIAEGHLVGGNMKTLEALAGSASDLRTAGKILFLEDACVYL
jgi:muramoyltetrapeptide carboxypeptidase